mmetsp:Transcript_28923/g.51659  ORF Transcript_28923/g.51659 Transcript_28923/m.51659 type:complete len:85 (+) Transcript_28923:511-765(+)
MHFKVLSSQSVVFVDETTYYRIHYWDLPGSDRYLPLTSRYAAGATAAIFVFDSNCQRSLEAVILRSHGALAARVPEGRDPNEAT